MVPAVFFVLAKSSGVTGAITWRGEKWAQPRHKIQEISK